MGKRTGRHPQPERTMTTNRPTPQQVRIYMQQRREEAGPPPSPERIRELLGWKLIPSNGNHD